METFEGITEPIDIIVTTHGKLEGLTQPCIKALYANTKNLFHLIVVDDSMPEIDDAGTSTPQWIEHFQIDHKNVTYVHSPIPITCGNQAINIGLSKGNARFIAIVVNSIIAEPNWDVVAVKMLADNPKIGIVGLKCLKLGWGSGDGEIESAGIYMNGAIPSDMGRDEPGHRLTESYPCFSVQWAFSVVRREAVTDNLKEDELWQGHVGWDDIDNSLYLRYKGWEAWYCGFGVGYHRTHATRGSTGNDKLYKNGVNGEKFYKRWGYWETYKDRNIYAPEHFSNGEIEFLCNANDLPLTLTDEQFNHIHGIIETKGKLLYCPYCKGGHQSDDEIEFCGNKK